jgi:glycosyltransferase involved in cell wall biosynthesis
VTPSTIIVVPCYNEAARLDGDAFVSFASAHRDVGFHFVDDGSSDGTVAMLRELARRNPGQLTIQALEHNFGKAEAVRQGMLHAASRGATYVGFWDADLATPLEEIPGFIDLLDHRQTLDMVFGSRVNLLGRSVKRNLFRHYVGRVFATAAATALGVGIYDTQCGAKIFRVSPRFVRSLEDKFIGGWIFDVEIVAREIQARRRDSSLPDIREAIYEQPLMTWRDVRGSKLTLGDFPAVALRLVRIYWKYLR